MPIINKIKIFDKNPEGGFILILALIGIMILLAVGFFALTVSTGDLQIAARSIDERRAFSAGETAYAQLLSTFNPTNLAASNATNVQVDPSDPSLTYSTAVTALNISVVPGGSGTDMKSQVFQAIITGKSSTFNSTVSIQAGMAGPPVPADTAFPSGQ